MSHKQRRHFHLFFALLESCLIGCIGRGFLSSRKKGIIWKKGLMHQAFATGPVKPCLGLSRESFNSPKEPYSEAGKPCCRPGGEQAALCSLPKISGFQRIKLDDFVSYSEMIQNCQGPV
ncbi:hypothetical protein CEXT_145911 [Caerostris extrusa]|uniref:Uncharacterized protein n=1 Tax=Caerostris extrusa TaxID=172846 RepID=A0AAV4SRQ2_CAEEX|nr:hypothetical protein CEXT_145911 [Caerostris extrusa]